MQTYRDVKDSGIDWMSNIPLDWEVARIASLFKFSKGPNAQQLTSEYIGANPGDFPVYSGQTSNSGVVGYLKDYDFSLPNGAVLVTTVGAKAMTARFIKGSFSLSQNCLIMQPRQSEIKTRYYTYAVQPLFNKERSLIPDHMQPSMRMGDLSSYRIPLPDPSVQERIADYLDEETAKIDTLISKQESLLSLLEEKRRATIIRTITHGLDNNTPLKDTGIDWLREIPDKWSIKPLFSYVRENKRSNKGMINENVLTLSYGNINIKNIDEGGLMPESFETYQIIHPGDIVMRLTDLQNDHKSLRVGHSDHLGIITSAYVSISSQKYFSKYLYYMLHAYDLMKVFYNLGGGLRQGMKYSDVKRLPAIELRDDEQRSIVDFLESYEKKVEETFTKTKAQIVLLKERRASLISNVVTGKVKV